MKVKNSDVQLARWNKSNKFGNVKIDEYLMGPPFLGCKQLKVECIDEYGQRLNFLFLYSFGKSKKRQVLSAGNAWKYTSAKVKKEINEAVEDFLKI